MMTNHESKRPTSAAGILKWALVGQLLLAGASLINTIANFCGACGKGSPAHAAIAGVGVAGYGILIWLHHRGKKAWIERGVFAAFATHMALIGVMVAVKSFCWLCALAAAGSCVALVSVVATSENAPRLIVRVLMPVFVCASLLSWTVIGIERVHQEERRQHATEEISSSGKLATPVLNVWVSPSCPYCQDFTQEWAPQLRKDFPELEIVYHPAESARWLRWKPTIALGNTVLFEGLPEAYDDLRYEIQIRTEARTVLN